MPIGVGDVDPVWKWAQLPSGGSQAKPVQPNSWVTVPASGQSSVPLYSDGIAAAPRTGGHELADLPVDRGVLARLVGQDPLRRCGVQGEPW